MGETAPNQLLRVCALLNNEHVEYLVVGGWALILHGVIRATEDVDILVADHDENFARVIQALSKMEDGAARELTTRDFKENVVIKIADEVEVDVSTRAWKVSYQEALPNASKLEVEGVVIPYLSLPDLIRSKETHREQDRADIERLRRLKP